MAGVYPDIPGTRFALDIDGTVMKTRNYTTGSAWTDISGSITPTQTLANTTGADMAPSTALDQFAQVAIAFPEARTISGVFLFAVGSTNTGVGPVSSFIWESSADTTDGTDGTWTSFSATFTHLASHSAVGQDPRPYYRSDIAPLALTNVKGIRIRWKSSNVNLISDAHIYVLHVYGSRPATGVDRLAYWDPTLDQAIAPAALDFGDIPQGSSGTRQARVKNLSGTKTANGVSVTISDLLPEYGTGDMQLSSDNVTYASSLSLGNLAPGAVSPIIYIRRTVPAAQAPKLRYARLVVNATSWT